jgi:signal transduction histidine kinase
MDAMDATTGPARQLTIQTRLNGGGSVEVAVMDFGSGISEAKMPHLFDTFFTTKADGMGLGLSIARSIIQAHLGGEPRRRRSSAAVRRAGRDGGICGERRRQFIAKNGPGTRAPVRAAREYAP